MPRLAPSLFKRARALNPHLATLLPACRDLASARRELRWIREHVAAAVASRERRVGDEKSVQQRLQHPQLRGGGGGHHRPRQVHHHHHHHGDLEGKTAMPSSSSSSAAAVVAHLCVRRGRGEPLQYVLGTQPFGPLEVRCRRGVLIPRPETEAWTARLADLLLRWRRERRRTYNAAAAAAADAADAAATLDILDVCTGTGCVALLLEALLRRPAWGPATAAAALSVTGLDVAPRAVALARENARAHDARVRFARADIFTDAWRQFAPAPAAAAATTTMTTTGNHLRVLVANPPYISPRGFGRDTGRSVRNFEPRLALVPRPGIMTTVGETAYDDGDGGAPEDVFYRRLWQVADEFGAGVVALEVGDMAQARRVAALALRRPCRRPAGAGVRRLEIWRDWPDMTPEEGEDTRVEVLGRLVDVKGSGHGRVVVCWFGDVDVAL